MGYHKNSFNRVILTGNIGQTPELRQTDKGVSYLRFSLATTYVFNDTDETTWHNCVVWGNSADTLAGHIVKGQKLQVEGRLRSGSFENGDGQKVTRTEILVEGFVFLSSPAEGKKADDSGLSAQAGKTPKKKK